MGGFQIHSALGMAAEEAEAAVEVREIRLLEYSCRYCWMLESDLLRRATSKHGMPLIYTELEEMWRY